MVSRNHENFPNVTTVFFGSCLLNTLLRAAPAVLGIVVAEGAFRGYANARIPLIASIVAALVPRTSMPFFSQKENVAVTTKESCTWF